MLESVRSRQLWGFLVLTVLPASAGIGYYLRSQRDDRLVQAVTPESASSLESTAALHDKIQFLRKREARLVQEEKELDDKLNRIPVGSTKQV
ncbi:hypothetical protein JCM10212_000578 [Sporobolomyces blumeae]